MKEIIRRLCYRFRADREVRDEIESHIEMRTELNQARGMSEADAAAEARRMFGNRKRIEEDTREVHVNQILETTLQDVRYALRTVGRSPGFAGVVVLTLALGIGATTSIFSVVNAVLFTPLPFPDADRLVEITENVPAEESFSGSPVRRNTMTPDEFIWWRDHAEALSDMAVTMPVTRTMRDPEGTRRLRGASVSPSLFRMRGVPPVVGRGLDPDDERPDASVVVLGMGAWESHFGSDPNVGGRTLVLDDQTYVIAGVMPSEFGDADFWIPFVAAPQQPGSMTFVSVSAKLADGISLEAATEELNVLGEQLRGAPARPGSPPRFEAVRIQERMVSAVRPALRVLTVAVGLVLLIVCANVANLLLARSVHRQHEIAVRRALGAGRRRIVGQLLTENVVLSVAGGFAGVVFAHGGTVALKALAVIRIPERFQSNFGGSGTTILPRVGEISIDTTVLGFALVLSVGVGLLIGLLPVLRTFHRGCDRPIGPLGSVGAAVLTVARVRLGGVLAVMQIGLATTLIVGASLLVHSFVNLSNVEMGFDPSRVLNFQLVLPGDYVPQKKQTVASELASRLSSLPQVETAGFTDAPPLLGGTILLSPFVPPGMSQAEMMREPMFEQPQSRRVSPGYLRALGARLTEGRWIDERDGPPGRAVVLISRSYARRYFGDRSPVGSVLGWRDESLEIVGVVDDVRLGGLSDTADPGTVFLDPRYELAMMPGDGSTPMADEVFLTAMSGTVSFAVRVDAGDPAGVASDLMAIVRQVDPAAAVEGVVPMEQVVSGLVTRPRFYGVLMSIFAVLAGLVAAVGIYGLLTYLVSQRTREIGIRMALGARSRDVLGGVLRHGSILTAAGITGGIAGGAGLSRYLDSFLFGLTPLHPLTYLLAGVAFAGVALIASYIPARRAARVDPLVAIRHE